MSKAVIAPIVAVLVLLVQSVFGVEIPEEVANDIAVTIVNITSIGVVLAGIFTNYKKEKNVDVTPEDSESVE